MFSETAQYYDKIYSDKDYQGEVDRLVAILEENLGSSSERLLDVACGTGSHIEHLKERFDVEGLDISQDLLEIAREKNPDVPFHRADMMDFDLGCEFDLVTCLFSSIGYVKTLHNLTQAVACMTRHLVPGGVLIIEPWFTPRTWQVPSVHATFIDEPDLKIARISTSLSNGRLSFFDFHYLIGTPEGTEHFVERHELGLFRTNEVLAVLAEAGLGVTYDAEGLTGRGLFIGRQPR